MRITSVVRGLMAAVVLALGLQMLPFPNYCNQCFNNNPAWVCYLAGCW